jgi:photosystem II stability/assembly factor-like uncharacterized protein
MRRLTLSGAVMCAAAASAALAFHTPALAESAELSAEPARLASRGLLIGMARAGERIVAVGDRGIVLLSDDQGRTWTQAASVPTQVLLTGVCFIDARRGIAVGHDEVILTTGDAGNTWTRTHYAPEAQQPLLDVWCGQAHAGDGTVAAGRAIALGAYSVYFSSEDGGATWKESKFKARPLPRKSATDLPRGAGKTIGGRTVVARKESGPVAASPSDPGADGLGGGFHLNRIAVASDSRFYIAGEAGHLCRSDDGGASWFELPSPYQGSFFGVLPLGGDALLAFGLRGNLFRSDDAGLTWQRIETGTVAMLDGGARLANGSVAVVGLSGVVLVSHDGGRSFVLL